MLCAVVEFIHPLDRARCAHSTSHNTIVAGVTVSQDIHVLTGQPCEEDLIRSINIEFGIVGRSLHHLHIRSLELDTIHNPFALLEALAPLLIAVLHLFRGGERNSSYNHVPRIPRLQVKQEVGVGLVLHSEVQSFWVFV